MADFSSACQAKAISEYHTSYVVALGGVSTAVLFFLFLPDFCPAGKNLEEKIVRYLAAAGEFGR
jgi:hypothetical protein